MSWSSRSARVALTATAVLTGTLLAVPAAASAKPPDPVRAAPLESGPGAGAGAAVPFVEQQAEDARTNGTVLGPDRAYGTLAAESMGRRSVRLQGRGKYVEFTLSRPANAVNVRYSIPDSADGAGLDATLGVRVNGAASGSLPVTSRYSWYYGQYPWTNNPADGGRRQLFDDSRIMFGRTFPAGTRVRFEVGAHDTAPWYVLDVADFEQVAGPAKAPARALSVLRFGADPTGRADSSDAIQRAIDAGRTENRPVWIPTGTFTVTRHLMVDRVTVTGAGPWYSVLHGAGVGVYGGYNPKASSGVHLSDFAIFGEVTERNDSAQLNGIGGALNDSTVDNLWIQHTKVGAWLDGPSDGLTMSNLRILDQTADGVNFHDGVTNSKVVDSYIRNTGDDGLAMWSENHPDAHNSFTGNTVVLPILANTIAIYGGSDNAVNDNLVADTVTEGGGIQIANRFNAVPLAGLTTVSGNRLVRTGSLGLFSHIGWGALWFWAGDSPITGRVDVTRNLIEDSSYEAVQFYGQPVNNVHFVNNTIRTAGTFGVQFNTSGSATSSGTIATGLRAGGRYDCDSGFVGTLTGHNTGWLDSHCGYPAPGPLVVSATDLAFTTDALGHASDPQTVTVTNPTGRPAHIASVTTTGAFTLTTTCGSTLAARSSCTVTLRFVPTARGARYGALTVSDGTPAGRYQVYVTGSVVQSSVGNLAAGRPMTASTAIDGYPGTAASDSNTDTYWESAPDAFPQTLTVDLGEAKPVSRVTLKLNGGWGGRTERVEVQGSSDGTAFTSLVPASDVAFDPGANNNTVNIAVPATTQRYLRIVVSANTGAPAAQIAEFEVYS